MYTPPLAPRKYGRGYGGIIYLFIGVSGKLAAGASTILSSSVASRTLLPNNIGDFILPQLGHSVHIPVLDSSNVLHVYGPFIGSIFFCVPSTV